MKIEIPPRLLVCTCLDYNWYKGKDGEHHPLCATHKPLEERIFDEMTLWLDRIYDFQAYNANTFNRAKNRALKRLMMTKYL